MSTASTPQRTTRRTPLAERRTRMVVCRLTEDEGDLVEQTADARGLSVSDLLREALVASTAR